MNNSKRRVILSSCWVRYPPKSLLQIAMRSSVSLHGRQDAVGGENHFTKLEICSLLGSFVTITAEDLHRVIFRLFCYVVSHLTHFSLSITSSLGLLSSLFSPNCHDSKLYSWQWLTERCHFSSPTLHWPKIWPTYRLHSSPFSHHTLKKPWLGWRNAALSLCPPHHLQIKHPR